MLRLRDMPAFLLSLAALTASGCHVSTHNGSGNNNVDIGTPFGSMQVKTDDKASGANTGLTPYPGATLVKKDKDDEGAADVNMSFGDFHLGVHAVDLETPDSQDKVLAFYRKDMARYGTVLTCRGQSAVGTPVRTDQGLTCGTVKNSYTFSSGNSDENNLELRAGSAQHQHIVGVHPQDASTHISLVALDLPGATNSRHSDNDRE